MESNLSIQDRVTEVDTGLNQSYPPPPLQLAGGAWIGLFPTRNMPGVAPDLQPLIPGLTCVGLIRYLRGTLSYNELIIGVVVRRGWRIGLDVQHIWVDDQQSLWGGRRIWGLHKQAARFEWNGASVQLSDDRGSIVTLTFDPGTALLPRLPVCAPFFGEDQQRRLYTLAYGTARIGHAGLSAHWAERFSYDIAPTPRFSLALKPVRLVFPAPITSMPQ